MHFQRHGEVRSGLDKAMDPQLSVTFEAKQLNLDGVHETVKEGAFTDALVKDEHVEKRQRVHVSDRGWFKTESSHLGKEIGGLDARAMEF